MEPVKRTRWVRRGSAAVILALGVAASDAAAAAGAAASTPAHANAPAGGHNAGPPANAKGSAGRRPVGGKVTALSTTSITVSGPQGSQTFALNSSTTYRDAKTASTFSALKVGDYVMIRPTLTGGSSEGAASSTAGVVAIVPAPTAGSGAPAGPPRGATGPGSAGSGGTRGSGPGSGGPGPGRGPSAGA